MKFLSFLLLNNEPRKKMVTMETQVNGELKSPSSLTAKADEDGYIIHVRHELFTLQKVYIARARVVFFSPYDHVIRMSLITGKYKMKFHYPFERIKNLQCYELPSRYNPMPLMLTLTFTYVVHPWSVHCESTLM